MFDAPTTTKRCDSNQQYRRWWEIRLVVRHALRQTQAYVETTKGSPNDTGQTRNRPLRWYSGPKSLCSPLDPWLWIVTGLDKYWLLSEDRGCFDSSSNKKVVWSEEQKRLSVSGIKSCWLSLSTIWVVSSEEILDWVISSPVLPSVFRCWHRIPLSPWFVIVWCDQGNLFVGMNFTVDDWNHWMRSYSLILKFELCLLEAIWGWKRILVMNLE